MTIEQLEAEVERLELERLDLLDQINAVDIENDDLHIAVAEMSALIGYYEDVLWDITVAHDFDDAIDIANDALEGVEEDAA